MLEACSVVSPVSASMIMYRVVAVFWVGCQKFSVRQMWGRELNNPLCVVYHVGGLVPSFFIVS